MANNKIFWAAGFFALFFLTIAAVASINADVVDFERLCEDSGGRWTNLDCSVPQEFCGGKVVATGCSGLSQLRCVCQEGSCLSENIGNCVPSTEPTPDQKECEGSGGIWELDASGSGHRCACPEGMIYFGFSMGGDGKCHNPEIMGKSCTESGGQWVKPSNSAADFSGQGSFICGTNERAVFMPRRICPEGAICDPPANPFYRCDCPSGFCMDGSSRCVADDRGSTAPCETVRGEVMSSIYQNDGGGTGSNICTKYTVKLQQLQNVINTVQQEGLIESGRDQRSLAKEEISPTSSAELETCAVRSNDLAASLRAGNFRSEVLVSPIRESFGSISWKYAGSIRYYQNRGYIDGKNSEFYYWNNQYSYYDYLAGNSFTDYKYGRAYSGDSICRIHVDKTSKGVIGYEVRTKPTGNAGEFDWQTATQTITRCAGGPARTACSHRDVYAYNFTYEANRGGGWTSLCQEKPYKCEEMRLAFSPNAEWFAELTRNPAGSAVIPLYDDLISPPTPLVACSDQTSCLSGTAETQLTAGTWGKGVQKIPANFAENTRNSLGSVSPGIKCQNGICVAYASGEQILSSTVPESTYYGQCRGYGTTLNTPAATVPSVTNNAKIDVRNRVPAVAVSFSKNPADVKPGEEVTLYCDAVDPDDCTDKIARVRWQCLNNAGQAENCFIGSGGSFQEGNFTQEIPVSEQKNPHRAAAVLRVSQPGAYAVSCEAWDNDANAPLSGYGIAGLSACADSISCGSVVSADLKFCSVIMDSEGGNTETTQCGSGGTFKFKAYTVGFDPAVYKWKCASSNATSEDSENPVKECSYGIGSFLPSLTVIDREGHSVECVSQASATVTDVGSCKIEAREAGSGSEYSDYSGRTMKVAPGETIEVRVKRQCLSAGETEWFVKGGGEMTSFQLISSQGDNALVKAASAGAEISGSVGAAVGSTSCGTLHLTVDQKFRLRN